jgi:alpha-tubulin suppressor-like RCC1 family protein
VKTDGSVVCWGYNNRGQATPPAGIFAFVSAGAFHTCGAKTDGTIACWGGNGTGQAMPPTGVF